VPAFMERPEQFKAYASASAAAAPSKKSNTGAIAGGVVGGIVALAIIAGLVFFFLRKKKRSQKTDEMGATSMMPMANEKRFSGQQAGQSRALRIHSSYFKLTVRTAPPTYTAPTQDYYQNITPNKGHQSYHQYASHADGPQELPTEVSSPTENRYSELPAEATSSMGNTNRYSELPAGVTTGPMELESPQITPRPLQSEFTQDLAKQNQSQGLGVQIEGPAKKN
jgi:hypothetical protein